MHMHDNVEDDRRIGVQWTLDAPHFELTSTTGRTTPAHTRMMIADVDAMLDGLLPWLARQKDRLLREQSEASPMHAEERARALSAKLHAVR